ncbi:MAG: GNAT family protein [Anaerolineae bacterium]
MIILSGERVILRHFTPDDLDIVLAGVNEPQSARLTGTHATFDRDQVAAYLQRNLTPEPDRAAFIFADIDTQRAIGEVVINELDSDNHSANIRIAIFDPADWGKGYGTDAMRLMVTYGFETLRLHRIELGVYDFNPRAIRAYEKAGFKHEGVRREALYWEGEYHNMMIMSVLEQEWTHSRSGERKG